MMATNRGKLVENISSETSRREQVVENTRQKTRRKTTRLKFSGGKLVARTENITSQVSDKYNANFVIILCF